MTAPLTVLQITDTHLQAPVPPPQGPSTLLGVHTAETLAAVLDQALAEREPDAIIASGDLAHEATAATYLAFVELVRSRFPGPVLYLPGNHDLAGPFEEVLGRARDLMLGRWHLLAFDTHVDEQVESRFAEKDRRSLMARIADSPADHVLLACHHHGLPVGCPWLDKDMIPGGRPLLESCAAEPRVRALVFGHVHQEVQTEVDGMPVLGTPSTCFQFRPGSARFEIDCSPETGQPGYRWLVLGADGAVKTELRRLVDYRLNIDMSDRS